MLGLINAPSPLNSTVSSDAVMLRPAPTMTDESTLLAMYKDNVLDPLSLVRELADLLAQAGGRVILVNGGESGSADGGGRGGGGRGR